MAEFQVFSLHDAGEARAYKRRKVHSKTATGCLACRAKRVKCDEQLPACARCRRNGRDCAYGSGALTVRQPARVVRFAAYEAGVPSHALMAHCQKHWDVIFDIPAKVRVLSMALRHPILAKTFVAMSAAHLRRQEPSLQHRIAEHYHSSSALQECQRLMQTPAAAMGQDGLNALTLSALLLNMLGFALAEPEDEQDLRRSWVFSEDENRLGWLTLQEGIRHLLRTTGNYLQPTIDFLSEIFVESGRTPMPWVTTVVADTPPRWREFFEIDETMAAAYQLCNVVLPGRGGTFFPAVNAVLKMPRADAGVKVYHFFPSLLKVNQDLRALLYKRDAKAMWLMGYWFALLLNQKNLWWLHGRVRRDYAAIKLWFEQSDVLQLEGREGELWAEMMSEMDKAACSVTS